MKDCTIKSVSRISVSELSGQSLFTASADSAASRGNTDCPVRTVLSLPGASDGGYEGVREYLERKRRGRAAHLIWGFLSSLLSASGLHNSATIFPVLKMEVT